MQRTTLRPRASAVALTAAVFLLAPAIARRRARLATGAQAVAAVAVGVIIALLLID